MKIIKANLSNGFMVCWDKIEDASNYAIELYLGYFQTNPNVNTCSGIKPSAHPTNIVTEKRYLETVIVDRNKLYYSFTNLADFTIANFDVSGNFFGYRRCCRYIVVVKAEDRDGNVIDQSDMCIIQIGEY